MKEKIEESKISFEKIIQILIISIFLIITITMSASAVEYTESVGDSIMVVGVNFAKTETDVNKYIATIIVDLNYKQPADPTKIGQYVKQYYWGNWWDANVIGDLFKDAYVQNKFVNINSLINADGTLNTTYVGGMNQSVELMPYYYAPIDGGYYNEQTGNCVVGVNLQNPTGTQVPCGDVVTPKSQIGYYGLPFYIESVEFVCDKNDISKGYKTYTQETINQEISLTRPSYPSITGPRIQLNGLKIPMGYITPGFVRLDGLKFVACERMSTTNNAGLKIMLKPNPLYRDNNPNIAGSETWSYEDIITGLGTGYTSSQNLPFNMNISFNFTGNFWNFNLVNGSDFTSAFDDSLTPTNAGEMDCQVYPNLLSGELKSMLSTIYNDISQQFSIGTDWTIPVKYTELIALDRVRGNTYLQDHTNTGDGITCSYTPSEYNNKKDGAISTDVSSELSLMLQRRNAIQLDLLDKKLETKRFIAKTIVPFFAIFIIVIFYLFQIALLGFLLFAFLPMFVKYFIKGIKEAFDVSEARKLLRGKK